MAPDHPKCAEGISGSADLFCQLCDEFEKVGFWDELDFIGLNSYYPLSKQDNPSKRELSKNFEGIKNKIKKVHKAHQKPIVFTEIGFRSIDAPWKNPHAEGDDSFNACLLYTSPSPRDRQKSRMPSSA